MKSKDTYVLWPPESDTSDTGHLLQPKGEQRLPRLALRTRLDLVQRGLGRGVFLVGVIVVVVVLVAVLVVVLMLVVRVVGVDFLDGGGHLYRRREGAVRVGRYIQDGGVRSINAACMRGIGSGRQAACRAGRTTHCVTFWWGTSGKAYSLSRTMADEDTRNPNLKPLPIRTMSAHEGPTRTLKISSCATHNACHIRCCASRPALSASTAGNFDEDSANLPLRR